MPAGSLCVQRIRGNRARLEITPELHPFGDGGVFHSVTVCLARRVVGRPLAMVPIPQVLDCGGSAAAFDHAENVVSVQSLQENNADPSRCAFLRFILSNASLQSRFAFVWEVRVALRGPIRR